MNNEGYIISISAEQLEELAAIASGYHNFQCVECAQAMKSYLKARGIPGKHIRLYTRSAIDRNSYIYDDSVPGGDPISTNGRHEAIAIWIEEVEMVFDNHHPNGLPQAQWMSNLLFFGKLHLGRQFQVTEEYF